MPIYNEYEHTRVPAHARCGLFSFAAVWAGLGEARVSIVSAKLVVMLGSVLPSTRWQLEHGK